MGLPELTEEERQALIDAAKRDQERQRKVEKRRRGRQVAEGADDFYFGID